MSSHGEGKLTGWKVVADGEVRREIRVDGARVTVLRDAADLLGANPDELREVSPCLKVAHVGVGLAKVLGGIGVDLAVVPHVGDRLGDDLALSNSLEVGSRAKQGKILAVAATAGCPSWMSVAVRKRNGCISNSQVVCEDALGSSLACIVCIRAAPLDSRSAVVHTVEIVVVDSSAGIVGGFSS